MNDGEDGSMTPAEPVVYRGYVDEIVDGSVIGWSVAEGQTDPVVVELLVDGVVASNGVANSFRPDLVGLVNVSGFCAFRLAIPKAMRDGQSHDVQVRVAGTDVFMINNIPDPVLYPPVVVEEPADLSMPAVHNEVSMSVIMPTFNRGEVMERTAERYLTIAAKMGAEVLIIDDGSTDDTPERLRRLVGKYSNLATDRLPNGGPAKARNLAAAMARGPLLTFVGDDVTPVDDDFLVIHAAAHRRFPERGQAVLGKISWPNNDELPVNYVMSHIQGEGEQQFGYRSMTAYTWFEWNLFYSSNVSVKKNIVGDWTTEGYDSSFHLAAFEDPEFALRTSLKLRAKGETFGIFYAPAAHLVHHHSYSVESFIRRQVSAGMMAQRFLEIHPDRSEDLGLKDLLARLHESPGHAPSATADHYFSIFEGLKSWAIVIDNHYGMGSQNWHGDLLRAVFQLGYYEGFLRMQTSPNLNLVSACRYVLERLRVTLNRAIATEALGQIPGFGLI